MHSFSVGSLVVGLFTITSTALEVSTFPQLVPRNSTNATEPCAIIGADVRRGLRKHSPETGLACLRSIPFNATNALQTLDMIGRICQYESNLGFIANPPEGYPDQGVDILGGLDKMATNVKKNVYSNEYDFEIELAHLFWMARDYHFGFKGLIADALITFARSRDLRIISASKDGTELPKVYLYSDAMNDEASAIEKINGQDATQFLRMEADLIDSNGPHTRYNQMFFQAGYGDKIIPEMFLEPYKYPGPFTTLTFANGTTLKRANYAQTSKGDDTFWKGLPTPQKIYVDVAQDLIVNQKRDVSASREVAAPQFRGITNRLNRFRTAPDDQEEVKVNWPQPIIKQGNGWPPAAGYFIDTKDESNVAVLVLPVFQNERGDMDPDLYLNSLLTTTARFIEECKSRKSPRLILDTRGNSGGIVAAGITLFRQLFPSTVPFQGNRISASDSVRFGMTTLANTTMKQSSNLVDQYLDQFVFDYDDGFDVNLKEFTSPEDKLGHNQVNGEKTSNIIRTGDALTVPTAFNPKDDDAFKPQDILLLSDGMCGSTCSRFAEMLTTDVQVKTLAVGGIPEYGPMAFAGGTKGSQVYNVPDEFTKLGLALQQVLVETKGYTRSDFEDIREFIPGPTFLRFGSSRLNVMDTMRNESSIVPTAFIVDNADCRIWYKPSMYQNPEELWQAAYDYAWGKDGDKLCVKGSTGSTKNHAGNSTPGHSPNNGNENNNSTSGQNNQGDDDSGVSRVSGSIAMMSAAAIVVVMVGNML